MKVNYRFFLPVEREFKVRHQVGEELFEIRFTPSTAGDAMRVLGRWAANPELRFTWYMAACMCNRIRQVLKEVECSGK